VTDTTEQAGDAGLGEAGQAHDDEIDTEAFDRAPAPADDDESETPADADKAEADDDQADSDKADGDDETFEIEGEGGKKFKVPIALKDHFLMRGDYTKKTQEVAETKRQLAEQAKALETREAQQAESLKALQAEYASVNILEARHKDLAKEAETYRQVDWARLKEQDPDAYETHRDRQRLIRDTLIDLDEELKGARDTLKTKEADRLKAASESATADLARRQKETGDAVAQDLKWTAEQRAENFQKMATFMTSELGVSPEELAEATDPRIWKLAHLFLAEREKSAKLEKVHKQQTTATNHEKAQQAKPAAGARGTAGASTRDPSTGRGDGLSADEWMRRRNAQVSKKRA
jgi:hypothetical protein